MVKHKVKKLTQLCTNFNDKSLYPSAGAFHEKSTFVGSVVYVYTFVRLYP